MTTLRLFIAIPLPNNLIHLLAQQQQRLQSACPVRWVNPAQIHLTLQFIGDFPKEETPALIDALREAVPTQAPFDLRVGGLGAFPTRKRPQVIWRGLAGDLASLTALHQIVIAATARCGIKAERRPYTPHLTLGYTARKASAADYAHISTVIQQQPNPSDQMPLLPVAAVHLIRSQLKPGGPIYTTVAEFGLR